jgi:hypothetical protein
MNHLRPFWWLLVASLLLPAAASAVSPQDFSTGFHLELDREATFYELDLPAAAYHVITRSDLGDLRVFNASAAVVPHQLRPQPAVAVDTSTQHRTLTLFPLPATSDGELPGDLSLHIERGAGGTIVDLRSRDDQPTKNGNPSGWLVDTGPAKTGRTKALTLSWAPTNIDAIGEVRIDNSSDLTHWTPLTTAAIASLSFQGQRLEQNRVVLPHQPLRYLRLTWPPALASLELTSIDLSYETTRQISLPLQHYTARAVTTADNNRSYEFQLPGPLPIEEIRLLLPVSNTLAECRLESAELPVGPWQSRWRGLVYRLGRGTSEIASPTVAVSRNRHRNWRLECTPSEAGLQAPPSIDFGWRPDRVLFLAQGEPPFLLAAGSQRVGPARFPVDYLKHDQITPGQAWSRQELSLGGEQPLEPINATLPWKKIILWVLLGGGVLLISGLAVSLHRQMRSSENGSDNRDAD